jgi:ElaB/YqjD/DUF883 family membrane-anchored ribosome-binding protein
METHEDISPIKEGAVSREKLAEDLRVLIRDADELLKATAAEMSGKAEDVKGRLKTALENARVTCRRLEEQTIAGAKAADRVIREHPYQSIAVALGVGVLAGLLINRK